MPFAKLFHPALWVLMGGLCGCQTAEPRLDTDGIELPDTWGVVNWMEVLHATLDDNNQANLSQGETWRYFQEVDPVFWQLWSEDILRAGPAKDSATVDVIDRFMGEMRPMLEAIDTTSGSPAILSREQQRLEDAFKRVHQLEPRVALPRIVWMPSGFNYAIYPEGPVLAVGLDWFMGASHPLHQELPPARFPAYRLARMRPDLMASSAFRGWALVAHQSAMGQDGNTADQLIYWGKIMTMVQRCFPDDEPWQLMDWTAEEWEWALDHERLVWRELQPQDVMFNTAPREVSRWFQEGPFTRAGALPQDCPDRLGIFMGWRIMEAFRAAHRDLDHTAYMATTSPSEILRHYRP